MHAVPFSAACMATASKNALVNTDNLIHDGSLVFHMFIWKKLLFVVGSLRR